MKHAHATHVAVTLQTPDGRVILDLNDDGSGFDTAAEFPGHLGLRSMRERVAAIGGEVSVTSSSGRGTRVSAWVPLSH
ncbi:MAG: ATP-binding protein [Tepidiformaceae bacterium]